jgi:DNA-binding PucR family transcriptional regulator
LRAYIDAECNATSAAPLLKIGRHTVESHVRTAEELLGRPLRTCLSELNVALCMDELDRVAVTDDAS